MAAEELSGRASRDFHERTLGDLLPAKTGASETDWVGLVRSIAGGDQLALQTLYQQTHRIVFTVIMRIVGNQEAAEEVTLDVFHEVWRRAPTYDPGDGSPGSSVVGWIMNQARSRAIDRVRFDTRKKRVENPVESPSGVTGESDPHAAFDAREQAYLLRRAVEALTSRERQVLETAFFSGLTYAETAARLNQPVGTVKTRIRSALAKLREALAETPSSP